MYPRTFVKNVTLAVGKQFPHYNQLLGERPVNSETGQMLAVYRVRESTDMRLPPRYAVYYTQHNRNGGALESQILTKEAVSHPAASSEIAMTLSTQWGEIAFIKPNLVPVRLGAAMLHPVILKT